MYFLLLLAQPWVSPSQCCLCSHLFLASSLLSWALLSSQGSTQVYGWGMGGMGGISS